MSRAGRAEGPDPEAGFTLLEMVAVMSIIAMLAAVALPSVKPGTSRTQLEQLAMNAASVFMGDRRSAVLRRVAVATVIDANDREIRSGASARVVRVPEDVSMRATVANTCGGGPRAAVIGFYPDGLSCGGTLALGRDGAVYEVRVNWLSGGVEIVASAP